MKQRWLLWMLAVLTAAVLKAQPEGSFTHYSSDDGLSENTVMDMLQDSRGNMWFSTWNGINKFDGYTFKTFKARQDNQIALTSNRVDNMKLDRYGFIWLQTYDDRAFRFDPRTEVFESVPAEESRAARRPYRPSRYCRTARCGCSPVGKGPCGLRPIRRIIG